MNNFGTNATPSTGEFYFGIRVSGTGGTHTVVNNTVMNLVNASTPDTSFNTFTEAIVVTATGGSSNRWWKHHREYWQHEHCGAYYI